MLLNNGNYLQLGRENKREMEQEQTFCFMGGMKEEKKEENGDNDGHNNKKRLISFCGLETQSCKHIST